MVRITRSLAGLFALSALSLLTAARATPIAPVGIGTPGANVSAGVSRLLGAAFSPGTALSVLDRSVYTDGHGGLGESQTVGIFNTLGELLAHASVDTADSLDGFFQDTPIATLTGDEPFRLDSAGAAPAPTIDAVQDLYGSAPDFVFPTAPRSVPNPVDGGSDYRPLGASASGKGSGSASALGFIGIGLLALIAVGCGREGSRR